MDGHREVRNRIWIVLWGIMLILTGCGTAGTEQAPEEKEASYVGGSSGMLQSGIEISSELPRYRNITYGEFLEGNEGEAEFLHGTFYSAQIDDTEIYAVFSGEYDEETAGPVLAEDAVCIRLEGKPGALFVGMEGEMGAADFAAALVPEGKDVPAYHEEEGAGTAYYVANRYLVVEIDSDGDSEDDTILEISLDESDKISPDAYAWIRWEE